MAININDYLSKADPFLQSLTKRKISHLDIPKLVALSDEDFAEFHLKLMEDYWETAGLGKGDKTLSCSSCHKEISEPKKLRKYYGASFHPECFEDFYTSKGLSKILDFYSKRKHNEFEEGLQLIDKYYQRVSKLRF